MSVLFADADSNLGDAFFTIFGVPFDGTCCFRKGASQAPKAIREASYNFETYLYEHDIDLENVPMYDGGDIPLGHSVEGTMENVTKTILGAIKDGKFPIVFGGEHSITPAIIQAYLQNDIKPKVLVVDAHLDLRDEYEGQRYSHACTTRRITEQLGSENVYLVGVRSFSSEEKENLVDDGPGFMDPEGFDDRGRPSSSHCNGL